MHVVKIQKVETVQGDRGSSIRHSQSWTEAKWKGFKCRHRYRNKEDCKCNILSYLENCAVHQEYYGSNAVFGAFSIAYNTHQDIILSPDDLWMVVSLHFSKHVNENAERLRNKFVSHEGKKQLEVTTKNELLESEWTEFFDLILPEIKKNTKDNITDTLLSDFSTTTLPERLISTACIMDAFKKYFEYCRYFPECGIRNACFMGTREDWCKLVEKVDQLGKCDEEKHWQKYVAGVKKIFMKFIDTYDAKVDVAWWNEIMDTSFARRGSGSTTLYSGWILHLFGIYGKCESSSIPSYYIDVPVKIDNQATGEKKTVDLVGGFGKGLHVEYVENRKAFRPQISMIVFHNPDNENMDPKQRQAQLDWDWDWDSDSDSYTDSDSD